MAAKIDNSRLLLQSLDAGELLSHWDNIPSDEQFRRFKSKCKV